MYYYKYTILILLCFCGRLIWAQITPPDSLSLPDAAPSQAEQVPKVIEDSLVISTSDSIGDIHTTIKYSAEDSFFFDYRNKIIKLFGNAEVTYGDISLKAAHIELDWKTNTVTANGRLDSTGTLVGKPVFNDAGDVYETESMSYNFNTKRAVIKGVVTQQGDAYMHAGRIKKDPNDIIYGQGMIYTTCNLPHPHFHIEARKFKKLPKGSTLVGPFHLEVNDIATPVGFLFGMFPNKRERSSGIVIPTYGEERRRGFYLRDGGYYFSISDYMDLKVLGEIYSKGSYGLELQSSYTKRYAFSGSFRAEMNTQKIITENDTTNSTDTWITWSHKPVSLRDSRISADVSLGSSSYNSNNFDYNVNRNIRQEFRSSVTYNKTLRGTPFSFGTAITFTQNVSTGVGTLTLPDITLNMNRIYPLKGLPGKSNAWYKKIYLGQNFSYRKTISNRYAADTVNGAIQYPEFWKNFGEHWRHAQTDQSQAQPLSFDIPLSTSFNVFKHFNLSPTINYTEQWFFNKLNYRFDTVQNRFVNADPTGGFFRAFRTSMGARLSTKLYGFYNPKIGGIQRIRHLVTPTVNFTYTPDLSQRIFGYYKNFSYRQDGIDTTAYLPRLPGASNREAGLLTFSLDNNVEMKILSKKDTTGVARKVALLEGLSFSATYDYLKEDFKLSSITFAGRTSIWQRKVSLSFRGVVDPYTYVLGENGSMVRIDRYSWLSGQGLGRFTSGDISINGNFSAGGSGGQSGSQAIAGQSRDDIIRENLTPEEQSELDYIRANPHEYVDFNIPWSFSFGYNLRYTRTLRDEKQFMQTVTFNGDLSLTEKWKIRFNSGYDFAQKEFTTTTLNIDRDLHCWQMSFTWVPFGRFQSYNVTINAKSSLLQDLKLTKRRSYQDRY